MNQQPAKDGVDASASVSERRRKPIVDLQPFTLPSTFWRSEYLDDATLAQHVPAMFWLVEAARPRVAVTMGGRAATLHFAMCQAVQRLALDTRCYGYLDEATDSGSTNVRVDDCLAHNERQYSMFSRIATGDSLGPVEQFEDGSVDILCFGADLAGDALQRRVDAWRPKLSERGILVVFGTNVSDDPDGVASVYSRVCAHSGRFEFQHGDGLGICATGSQPPPLVEFMFEARRDRDLRFAVRNLFWRLGRSCSDAFVLARTETKVQALRRKRSALERQIEQERESLEEAQARLAKRSEELRKLTGEHSELQQQRLAERARSGARIEALEQVRADLEARLASLRQDLVEAVARERAEIARHRLASERNLAEIGRLRSELESTRAQSQARAEALTQLMSSWSWRLTGPLRTVSSAVRRMLGRS